MTTPSWMPRGAQQSEKCRSLLGYTEDEIVEGGVLNEDMHFLAKPYSRRSLGFKLRAVLDAGVFPRIDPVE